MGALEGFAQGGLGCRVAFVVMGCDRDQAVRPGLRNEQVRAVRIPGDQAAPWNLAAVPIRSAPS
jgi:hypothetical protein